MSNPSDLPVDHPDYVPACDHHGDCEVSEEDEASGAPAAMCIHCGGWRYRNHPYFGNWGTWTPDLVERTTIDPGVPQLPE